MSVPIPFKDLYITKKVNGVIHIGAHECEERSEYKTRFDLGDDKILWFEALPHKVEQIKQMYPEVKIYNECMSNTDDVMVEFIVTNNFQSSSMLELKTHLQEHPHIFEISRIWLPTRRLDTFVKQHNILFSEFNFMNLDIQGAELLALQGCGDLLKHVDYIYTEVNEKELYQGCCLVSDLDTFLNEWGFVRVLTHMTQYGWGDAFYIRKETISELF